MHTAVHACMHACILVSWRMHASMRLSLSIYSSAPKFVSLDWITSNCYFIQPPLLVDMNKFQYSMFFYCRWYLTFRMKGILYWMIRRWVFNFTQLFFVYTDFTCYVMFWYSDNGVWEYRCICHLGLYVPSKSNCLFFNFIYRSYNIINVSFIHHSYLQPIKTVFSWISFMWNFEQVPRQERYLLEGGCLNCILF